MLPTQSQQLGRYTLLRRLASGGMGEIYLAEAQGAANFTKRVAIKRILPHLAGNPDFVTRFIDEANVMVQLHHGNIVPVLELGDQDGELYLVMDYLPGRDLKAVIHELRRTDALMPPELALWLVAEVCAGLDYAHRKVDAHDRPLGIVHRDVSPSNVVLGASGAVKLTDFGIARAEGRLQNSVSGTLQGKFVYMSPEQAEGKKLTAQSDVFSAGLVLYELLCAVRPFEGESETETLRLARTHNILPPSEFRSSLKPAVDGIVARALSRELTERYESAAEMGRAIRHYLALEDSTVGADTLASFLGDLFPDGVIPSQTEIPRSVDDALNMQLNALTPSVESMLGTRTGTGPVAVWNTPSVAQAMGSAPGLTSGSMPSGSVPPFPAATTGTHPSVVTPTKPTGRKRALALGLLLGLVFALALFTWEQRPKEVAVSIDISPQSVTDYEVLVDGARFNAGDLLIADRMYTVCALAKDYEKTCKRIRVTDKTQAIDVRLKSPPLLNPRIFPKDIKHTVLVDQVPAKTLPMRVVVDRKYVVCVEAEGYRTPEPCQRVIIKDGLNRPSFTFSKWVSDAGVPPATSGGVPAPPSVANVTRTRPKPAQTRQAKSGPKRMMKPKVRIKLKSIPTAQVWRDGVELGTTPMKVAVESRQVTYTLKARGYANTEFKVNPDEKRRMVNIPLLRPAYLTMRVIPPASEIWLNGGRVGKGYLRRLPIRPGRHRLELRYYLGEKLVDRYGPVTITAVSGEENRMKPITLSGTSNP